MRYILVVTHDTEVDHIQGFDDLKKAKKEADEEIGYFDIDHNPGSAVVFELDPKTGTASEVYRPEMPDRDDAIEDDDIQ